MAHVEPPTITTRDRYSTCSLPCPDGISQRTAGYTVALLMALHPPKYKWAGFFSKTLVESRAELLWVPIFSAAIDFKMAARSFLAMPPNHPARVEPVILSHSGPLVDSAIGKAGKTMSDVKKFYGVRWLFCCTAVRFAVTVDAEVAIMAPGLTASGLLARMQAWADRQLVMAAAAAHWVSGANTCLRAMSLSQHERHLVTDGLTDLFWWWSDVPAYDRRDYDRFWKRLTRPDSWDFEHTAYLCFKLLTGNWSIALINPLLVEAPYLHPELQTRDEFEVIKQMNPISCCGLQGATLQAQAALELEYGYSFQILNGYAIFSRQRNGGISPEEFVHRHKGSLGERWLLMQLDHRTTHGRVRSPRTSHASGLASHSHRTNISLRGTSALSA